MFAFNSYHHPQMVPNHHPQSQPQPQPQYQNYYGCGAQPLGFNCYGSANPPSGFVYNSGMNVGMGVGMNMNMNMNMGMGMNVNVNPVNMGMNMGLASNSLYNNGNNNNNNNNTNNNIGTGNNGNNQPNGGVASVLDYDLDQMVKFLSWVTFGLVKKSMSPSLAFQKSINSVLSATRLPKSTLLLAINYLSNKMDDDLTASPSHPYLHYNEDEIFKILITALILSNKFNDDKTFRNKSWSDATNLPLLEINKLERSWLMDCNYELFKTNSFSMVESCWNTWCIKNIQSIDNTSTVASPAATFSTNSLIAPLTPISTNPPSPMNPSCCYYDNNTIPNQIFENPFQNVNHAEGVIGNQHQPHPSLIISPANDFPYMNNEYLEMPMAGSHNKSNFQIPHEEMSCYNNNSSSNNNNNYYSSNNGNTMQTINPHHLEYENDHVANYDMNSSYNYGLDYIYNGYSNYGCFNGYNYCAATAC